MGLKDPKQMGTLTKCLTKKVRTGEGPEVKETHNGKLWE